MFLLDEHLSPRLCRALAVEFPGTIHVHEAGLGNADDIELWHLARKEKLIIVTKDSDFPDLQGVMGFPPKIVWIRVGNCSTAAIENLLRSHRQAIERLRESPELGLLILT